MDPFKSIKTYDDLIGATIAFLEGKIPRTPYHHGPVAEETRPLLGKLIRINAHGFVSTNGQPALLESSYIEKSKLYYQVRQKPYITGYLPGMYLDAFLAFMATRSKYDYRIFSIHRSERTISPSLWTQFVDFIMGRKTPPTVRETVELVPLKASDPDFIDVTDERVAPTPEKIQKAPWEHYTVFPEISNPPPLEFNQKNILDAMRQVSAVYVEIIGNTFAEGSTEDLLLDFFDSLKRETTVNSKKKKKSKRR